MALTSIQVRSAEPREKPWRLSDEKSLYLQIMPNGKKYWRMNYRFNGKQKTYAVGVFPEVSLKAARSARDDARRLLADGIDPMQKRKAARLSTSISAENSFQAIALEWFENWKGDKSETHKVRTQRQLEKDLFPYLGDRPISEIEPPDLLAVLRRIESRGALETAKRTKNTAGLVFRYAIATGRATRNPVPDLAGALKVGTKSHFAAITEPGAAGRLMLTIESYSGSPVVQTALRLSPLLFCRPGELRQLQWTDVNWPESRIEIPGARMKMKDDHIIPLSSQAEALLKELYPITGRGTYIFPSARGGSRPLSDNGVRTALRTLGYSNEQMTPHGFRAMASTLLRERLDYPAELVELQLAHRVPDANGRAYNRTRHIDKRAAMMQRWADYLDVLREEARGGNVVTAQFPLTKSN